MKSADLIADTLCRVIVTIWSYSSGKEKCGPDSLALSVCPGRKSLCSEHPCIAFDWRLSVRPKSACSSRLCVRLLAVRSPLAVQGLQYMRKIILAAAAAGAALTLAACSEKTEDAASETADSALADADAAASEAADAAATATDAATDAAAAATDAASAATDAASAAASPSAAATPAAQ